MSHFPKQGFRLALDFRNETGAMQGDSRHDRRPAGKQRPHRGDKPLREALHLADLIHNVDSGALGLAQAVPQLHRLRPRPHHTSRRGGSSGRRYAR